MKRFADSLPVLAARKQFFDDNGFSLAEYTAPWVRFRVGPLPVVFPNTTTRKRAVPFHDLHHIATGYATDLVGETELAAWELAAGCGRLWAAWVLNGLGLAMGAVIAPRRTWAAWKRGRSSHTLYEQPDRDAVWNLTVGELRARLQRQRPLAGRLFRTADRTPENNHARTN